MNGGNINLKIVVKDKEGKEIKEVCKNGDLFTKNWGAFLAGYFKLGFNATSGTTYMVIDENGTARYLGSYSTNTRSVNSASPINCDFANAHRVAVGSSNAPPTIDDFKLGAEISRTVATTPQFTWDSATGKVKVVFSATFSFSSQQTVSEAGLFINVSYDTSNNRCNILVARDVFEAVIVPEGGSITVQYELVFN